MALLPRVATPHVESASVSVHIPRGVAIALLVAFFVLLLGLPWLADASGNPAIQLVDSFYRAGSLVFGGGHVVLPLLQTSVVQARMG
jgi:chromate transporter